MHLDLTFVISNLLKRRTFDNQIFLCGVALNKIRESDDIILQHFGAYPQLKHKRSNLRCFEGEIKSHRFTGFAMIEVNSRKSVIFFHLQNCRESWQFRILVIEIRYQANSFRRSFINNLRCSHESLCQWIFLHLTVNFRDH